MPHYMFQARYTARAIKAMVENPQDREAPARELIQSVGGKLAAMFFCFGSEDVLAIIEAPSDEAAAACSMAIGASGSFSGGATSKRMTPQEAMAAMATAQKAAAVYKPVIAS